MHDDPLMTTTAAARLAQVGVSTVKRWADSRLIPCVKTAGGHRRFRRSDIERLLEEGVASLEAAQSDAGADWVDSLENAEPHELQSELMGARSRLGSWHAVADELGAALTEIGERWAAGRMSVLEEHIAVEKLQRAIHRICELLPTNQNAPRALLAMASGDEHTMGLLLAELCLKEAGFHTSWAGRRTPREEILAAVRGGRLKVVAISASRISTDAQALAAEAAELGRACVDARVKLVVGGNGAWREPLEYAERIRDFRTLNERARTWLEANLEQE